MKKDFFGDLVLNNEKKSLKPGKKFWSWLFLTFAFCGALFIMSQTSIFGADQNTSTTSNLVFYKDSTSGTSGDDLANLIDIYVFTGSNAPESPFDSSQSSGLATGVSKVTVTSSLLQASVTSGDTVTIYTKHTDACSSSNYTVAVYSGTSSTALTSLTSNEPEEYSLGQITADTSIVISGLSQKMCSLAFKDDKGSTGDALAQMIDVYVFTGSNAPSSPLDSSQSSGLATGVSKVTVTDSLLQASVAYGKAVTFYTNPTAAYSKSNYTVKKSSDGTTLVPVIEGNFQKYGLASSTADSSISISGLSKNTYAVTFLSGDSNYQCLPDRVSLFQSDGQTALPLNTDKTGWSTQATYGDSPSYIMKPVTGYDISNVSVKLNGSDFTPTQGTDQVTLSLTDVTQDEAFVVTNVAYKKYNIYFTDENNQAIPTSKASITEKISGSVINTGSTLAWKSSLNFMVNLQSGYSSSDITVTAKVKISGVDSTITLSKDTDNYYMFPPQNDTVDPQDVTITVSGITLNMYNFACSLTDSSNNGQVKMLCNQYVYSSTAGEYQQTGSSVEMYPTYSTAAQQSKLIPHGYDFQVYFQIVNTSVYDFNYSGATEQDITYSSSDSDALNNIINASSIKNVSGIQYRVNSSKTQLCVTFKGVTQDLSVPIKSINKIDYKINFSAPANMSNDITLYTGTMINFNNVGYFKKGDQIFGSSVTGTISGIKSESYYFSVNLDSALAADSGGVQCTCTGGTVARPSYSVYSTDDSSVLTVFEITGVTGDSVSVSISGIHFSTRSVTFSTVNGATVTNYADESTINTGSAVAVNYGNSIKLKIAAKEGYYLDDTSDQVTVLDADNPSQTVSFDYESYSDHADVTISNIQKNLSVNINVGTEEMPVTFNNIEGCQYYAASNDSTVDTSKNINGIVTVSYGQDYYFAVKAEIGYDVSTVALKNNGISMTSVGSSTDKSYVIFKISSVKSNASITGSISKIQCKVSFDTTCNDGSDNKDNKLKVGYYQDGVDISGGQSVSYGGSISFQVSLPDECNQSDLKVYCSSGDDDKDKTLLSSVSGTYSVSNITQDWEIKVENLSLNKYVINFTATDSAYYVLSDSSQITSGTQTVNYNTDYSFGVQAKTGYVIGSSMVVNCTTASGVSKSLTADATSGKYKISNITEGCTISIENVDNIVYNITLTPIDGVTYYNDTGSVISGTLKIKYGQNFEFAVGVADAYDDSVSGMYITVNNGSNSNESAQKLSSGRYVITNVTEDITIKVGNITKNTYTVTLTKIEGIDYYGTTGKIITGDNKVEDEGSLTFRVYLYPAYSDSSITVMLGNNAMTSNSDGTYTISGINESKTVTVTGVSANKEVDVINEINSLPSSVSGSDDVSAVIKATNAYNNLSDEKKANVTNLATLESLQAQAKSIQHTANSVTVDDSLDWYIKLVANPISTSDDAYTRIYGKLSSGYVLSLYDIYLWDSLNDKLYTLPEGKSVTITLPTPDMTYFENATGIHEESSDGKLDYVTLKLKSTTTTFSTTSFCAMGIMADRSSTPGRSSLLDAVDANVESLKNYTLATSGSSSSSTSSSTGTTVSNTSSTSSTDTTEGVVGNISDNFKSSGNNVTTTGSALRLTLVLMILILIAVSIWVIVKNRKKLGKNNSK